MDIWLIKDSTTGSLLDIPMVSFSKDGKAAAYQSYSNMCYSLSFNFDELIKRFPRFLIDCIVVKGDGSFDSDMYEVANTKYFDNVSFTSYLEKYINESNAKLILLSKKNELYLWDKVFVEFVLHGRMSGKI